jgi:hypothetical protein
MCDSDVITHFTTTPLVLICVKAEYLFPIPIRCFFFQWSATVSSYRWTAAGPARSGHVVGARTDGRRKNLHVHDDERDFSHQSVSVLPTTARRPSKHSDHLISATSHPSAVTCVGTNPSRSALQQACSLDTVHATPGFHKHTPVASISKSA